MDIFDTEAFALEPKLSWVNAHMLCGLKTFGCSYNGKFGLVLLHLNSVMNFVFRVAAILKSKDVSIKNVN